MSDSVRVYSYRYMWKLKDSDKVNFKIVTDVFEGISRFESELLKIEGLESCAREYLHEYDCSLIGVFEKIYDRGDKNA